MIGRRYLPLYLLALFFATPLLAQPVADEEGDVGIGTNNPDPSAVLDLTSNRGGLLIPRMTTAERNLIPNPAEGLMVYNMTTGVFEYNAGTPGAPSWQAVGGDGNAWQLNGNTGTDPATNFLGTTDAQPVVFRTDDTERMRLTGTALLPGADDTYDLGSPAFLWHDLFLGPTSLHFLSKTTESEWTMSIEEGENPLYRSLLFKLNGGTLLAIAPSGRLVVPALGFPSRQGPSSNIVLADENGELTSSEPGGVIDDYAWSLSGNAGTDSAVNFLGTTDAEGLSIRTNNVGRVMVSSDGNVGIGATDPAVSADVNGALAVRPPATVNATTASTTVTVGDRSYIRVDSDSDPFNREVTLSDGLQDGQILVLQCLAECDNPSETYDGIELDTDNIVIDRDHNGELYTNDTVTLIWDEDQGLWIMLSFSDTRCPDSLGS